MKRLVFIGSNPAVSSRTGRPFDDCASGDVLDVWLAKLGLTRARIIIDNVVHKTTTDNRPLTIAEIRAGAAQLQLLYADERWNLIVPLGNTALRACQIARLPIYEYLPHPSPRNRRLNDKAALEKQLLDFKAKLKKDKII